MKKIISRLKFKYILQMYDKVYHKNNYTTGKSLFQLANAQNMKLVP